MLQKSLAELQQLKAELDKKIQEGKANAADKTTLSEVIKAVKEKEAWAAEADKAAQQGPVEKTYSQAELDALIEAAKAEVKAEVPASTDIEKFVKEYKPKNGTEDKVHILVASPEGFDPITGKPKGKSVVRMYDPAQFKVLNANKTAIGMRFTVLFTPSVKQ